MKCQILFSGKNKENFIKLSSAEIALRVVKVKEVFLHRLKVCLIHLLTTVLLVVQVLYCIWHLSEMKRERNANFKTTSQQIPI